MNRDLLFSIRASFQELGYDLVGFIPELIVAIVVVVVGWIIGGVLQSIIVALFKKLRLTEALDKAGVDTLSERAGYSFKPAAFVGGLVKWFVILVFTVAALDVLGLTEVTTFFTTEILTYIPRVVVAVCILFGALVVANLVAEAVTGATRAAGFSTGAMLGRFAKYAIIVFAVLAALNQLQIAAELVQLLFAGLVFGLSLAFGLAFGLGGRESAKRVLEKLERRGKE